MTQEIKQLVTDGLARVSDQVKAGMAEQDKQIAELKGEITDLHQRQGTPAGFGAAAVKTLGSVVSSSEQIKALASGNAKSVTIPGALEIKTLVGDAGSSNDDPFNVAAQRDPGIYNAPRRKLSLLDVLPVVPATSNSFEFIRLDGFTNKTDYQLAEGDLKAEQDMPTGLQTAPIVTLAAYLDISEQLASDAPGLRMFIDQHMRYAVREKLEREILTGAGGTGAITGLLTQATTFNATAGDKAPDAIGAAMAQLEGLGWTPGAIVVSPAQWHAVRSERATGDEYVTTGWQNPAAPSVWGVPVITSSALAVGEILVLDPSQLALLDRMQVRTDVGYHSSGFIQNRLTMRTELRGGLAVFSPSAVLKVVLS